ncbi:MAG: diacylglycerol kinase family protein [Erythrobacter sp.]
MSTGLNWLIVNAKSGSNSDAALEVLHAAFAERGIEIARQVDFPDEKLPDAAVLTAAGVKRLLIYTGDGSLNAAVAQAAGWEGEVLVLPGGTMNLLCIRLHGEDATLEEILDRFARGATKPIRPLMARCDKGDALAGLLVGPGTAWVNVREAMRDFDIAGVASGTGEAVAESTGGARVRLVEPETGHEDGYPLVEITPSDRGMQVDGYRAEGAGDFLQQGWALLRRRFREGPHERLGMLDRMVIESCAGEPVEVLIDGEPATLGPRAEFTVAPCEVDLLATDHGF